MPAVHRPAILEARASLWLPGLSSHQAGRRAATGACPGRLGTQLPELDQNRRGSSGLPGEAGREERAAKPGCCKTTPRGEAYREGKRGLGEVTMRKAEERPASRAN